MIFILNNKTQNEQQLFTMKKQIQDRLKVKPSYILDPKYNIISYQMRKTLIDMVQAKGLSIYKAGKILNIKNSTAKAIMRTYRRQGRIFQRKHQMQIDSIESVQLQQQITNNNEENQQKMETCNQNIQAEHQGGRGQLQESTFNFYWYIPIPQWANISYLY